MRRIAVIGGGISGLAAALRLQDIAAEQPEALQISLYEPQDRLGGCIQTWRENGFVLEGGADSILADKPAGMRMLTRLGLADRLCGMLPEFKGARIVHRGKLRRLPSHFRLFSPTSIAALVGSGLFSPAGVARAAMEPLIPRRTSNEDESLGSFVRRRFGREVLDRLAQPLLAGIYSADPERLSMEATLPQFRQMEQRYGSVMRAMRAAPQERKPPVLMSLPGGLGTLVEAIANELHSVERMHEAAPNLKTLRERYDAVICAIPAYAAAEIVRETDAHLAALLDRIHYNSIATITLGYPVRAIPALPRTQGFIVPFVERRGIVAATIVSQKYPQRAPDGWAVLRVFCGGALQPELVHQSDEQLEVLARKELADLLAIHAAPEFVRISRMFRVLPEYAVGHTTLVREIEQRAAALGGLALAGSAYHGVGIPDCIGSGEVAAERLLGTSRR
ncbi:MAG TPA: protoporphyrinogen oxidase [Candidatus Baltobacteraceae bacterium]|jgi:oxygen-dependent protoporphyrinogen oxidase|nr:protoporphyrinogen oxidase [Candidatus Baltobacteraceae bacterium]